MEQKEHINRLTAHLFRENAGKMAAVLSRMFGIKQIDGVLDIVQDSFEAALKSWRFSGVPANPAGWLMQVAKNKAINYLKRENKTLSLTAAQLKQTDVGFEDRFDLLLSPSGIKDSQLRLLFICCHRQLPVKTQIIITLNILCGFGVPEIANALLMNDEAVKKTLLRGKASLRELDETLFNTAGNGNQDQIRTIQTILYLMFNEGYKTTRNKMAINNELCYEAIRLSKLLSEHEAGENKETQALLALMFFTISRFPERLSNDHEWLSLEEQDRSRWNKVLIEEGYLYLKSATASQSLTKYHLEAIIASLHCSAASFGETDWEKIAYLYRQLELIDPSPIVSLNRIIAESFLPGFNSIKAIDEICEKRELRNSYIVQAAKGDICKRRGELKNARKYYEEALKLPVNQTDRKFLEKKISECHLNKN